MKKITQRQALFLMDIFCFTVLVLIIGGLMYLMTIAILSL